MPSERVQRTIDQVLDEAERAAAAGDWTQVQAFCQRVLRLDPENEDARNFLAAAEREPVIASPRPAEAAGSIASIPTAGEAAEIPTSFANGRYTVRRFLGEGGKKEVYLAHDTLLDRDVAFALIKTEGLDDVGRDRITREAQAMGRLGAHPHIVSVFDLGEEPGVSGAEPPSRRVGGGYSSNTINGQPYIVTEFMGGGDIEGLIEKAPEHRPPLERTLEIGIQVCRGPEFAHGHGIVHRDLKPGNVWLTADGTAKLGDFGLAVALDRSRLTQAGMMVGTVSYMPPEQAMGGEVTPQSDLYSLGAMLYEMVTGHPPFIGYESVAIITQHLNAQPVVPSWHNRSVPPALETLILRLLEKDASKRPGSAVEVREALEAVVSTRRLAALPEPDAETATAAPTENPIYRRAFVGREAELRQLQAAYDAAVSGQGALAMVVGEPGVGKTSLCEQLATYAAIRGGRTLVGHCYEEGSLSLPYLPFVEAMRSYVLARDPDDLRQDLGSGAAEIARIVSEIRDRLRIEPRPAGDPDEDRWRLLQGVAGFLRSAASVQPLLIVLEDLHDADRGTLDLLLHLGHNLAGARLLVVGTYRDVEVDRSHPLSNALAELRRGGNFSRVALRGLSAEEVQRMLSTISGQEVRWDTSEAVHRQTEGNPLFVQEVLRYLVEEGLITRQDGRWRTSAGTPIAMSIPEGLRDVIGKRLSRLSPECNHLLAIAAVVGRDFRLETLQAVAGVGDEELLSALEEAIRVAVLSEQPRVGGVQYRFAHAFFRQTLYEETIAPRRLRLHRQVAAALERQYAGRLDEHAAELAEHFSQSTDENDLRKAVHYGRRAAGRAVSVYSFAEAARHLDQALAVQEVLDPNDQAMRCDLLLELGDALVSLGETDRPAHQLAPDALRLAESLGDRRRASAVCRLMERVYGSMTAIAETDVGENWAELADKYADEGTVDRVHADAFRGWMAMTAGRTVEGLALWRRANKLALQLNDTSLLVTTAMALLNGNTTPPEAHDERLEVAEELSKRPLEGIRNTTLAVTLLYLGQVYLSWGRRAEAEHSWRSAAEAANRSREAEMALVPMQIEALLGTLDGRLESILELGDRIRQRGEEVGHARLGIALGARAIRRALVYLGNSELALDGIQQSPDLFLAGGVFAAQRAVCLAYSGRPSEARELMSRMLASRDMGSPDDPTPTPVLRYLLETAILLREESAAQSLAARLAPLAGLLHTEADMCYNIGRLCGGAAALLGDQQAARRYYQQAIDICEKVRFRPELALTRLELAELLLAAEPGNQGTASHADANRPHAEAVAHLDFAIAEFREMKMQPSLERSLRHKEVLKA